MRLGAAFFICAGTLGATANAVVPSHAEAVAALVQYCPGLKLPVVGLKCQDFGADEPTEAVCSYLVRASKKTLRDKTYFAIDAKGWHLIDTPAYCPGQKQGK